ncbi:hypothetical protein RFI_18407 [Reticulomyxa filosa]|uniref:Uncharacterized protein n=1 Tax=Reticulomyxa filosa TaxID=46433 RepID=X6MYY5_RETFI|nr:hypothetical protein RFI_18407 [Reticulomyxa filosa]|eukprot:ETO18838.1 hypothetical protein RFI_18407 [Reticulomyxa filosa]
MDEMDVDKTINPPATTGEEQNKRTKCNVCETMFTKLMKKKKKKKNGMNDNEKEASMLAEENLRSFLEDVESAETNLRAIEDDLETAQQVLLKEFVMKSLGLMHRYNKLLKPIHDKMSAVQQPLSDILLSFKAHI